MNYFTIFKHHLVAPFELSMEERRKIDFFLQILEDANIGSLIEETTKSDHSLGGRKPYNPYRLFAIIIYSFSQHSGSLRKIEESLNFDLRFMYLMDYEKPSYVSISKFLNNVVVKHHKTIFTSIVKVIISKYNICIDDVFLDGSKIEANANKYKFVWKPITFHKKLNIKIRELLLNYFHLPDSKQNFTSKEIGNFINSLLSLVDKEGISLSNRKVGRGLKSPKIVKDYSQLSKFLLKVLEYEEKETICGEDRNSYYKTDHDATAMTLKEDYYSGLGSNMKAGYCLQIIVAKGIILDYYVSQDRTDFYAFIPTLKSFHSNYGFYPKNLCADAGYGSIANYQFLSDNNINNFVKYTNWRQETLGRSIDLYKFNESKDLVCLNDKTAVKYNDHFGRHPKTKGHNLYVIDNCTRCKYKAYCMIMCKNKKSNNRVFEASYSFYVHKTTARANLLSAKGIEMRVNRSSQVEGAFGVIKQDMNYDRIRRRGLDNVTAEIMLVCLGYVIRKLFTLIEGKAKMDYWKAPENLQPEELPVPNIEKILKRKKRVIGKNESIRQKSKRKKRIRKTSNAVS